MTKEQTKIEKIYVVVPEDAIRSYSSLEEGEKIGRECCLRVGIDYKILEVTKVWHVTIPMEPEPEVDDEDLENLL